jgi:hypothetical protein
VIFWHFSEFLFEMQFRYIWVWGLGIYMEFLWDVGWIFFFSGSDIKIAKSIEAQKNLTKLFFK